MDRVFLSKPHDIFFLECCLYFEGFRNNVDEDVVQTDDKQNAESHRVDQSCLAVGLQQRNDEIHDLVTREQSLQSRVRLGQRAELLVFVEHAVAAEQKGEEQWGHSVKQSSYSTETASNRNSDLVNLWLPLRIP